MRILSQRQLLDVSTILHYMPPHSRLYSVLRIVSLLFSTDGFFRRKGYASRQMALGPIINVRNPKNLNGWSRARSQPQILQRFSSSSSFTGVTHTNLLLVVHETRNPKKKQARGRSLRQTRSTKRWTSRQRSREADIKLSAKWDC